MNNNGNLHNRKPSILIYEKASQMCMENTIEGRDNLVKLGKAKNVMHLKDITNDNEYTEDTLLAAQSLPGIVLKSFAIEIALKELLFQAYSTEVRGHDLGELFSKLNCNQRKTIEEKVREAMNDTSINFTDELQSNSLGFVKWRYFYEESTTKKGGFKFLDELLKSIKEEIVW